MLENSENLKGLDRSAILARMVGELPWANLRAYVQANAQLLKLCTAGGHRLDPKRRKRVEKLVLREMEKTDLSAASCSGLFAVWYPVHENLHKTLEDHFHSDEYKAYREENELAEEDYVLTPEKFDEFFQIDDLDEWRALLCFSPLEFTDEQAAKILDDSQGNARLLERIRTLEAEAATNEKRQSQLEAENSRIKEAERQAAAAAQEAKKTIRTLRAENESLGKKLEIALADAKKLRAQIEKSGLVQEKNEARIKAEVRKTGARLQNDLARAESELAEWTGKYEDQRVENRQLQEDIAKAGKRLLETEKKCEKLVAENQYLNAFADLILDHIDWAKVGGQMKLTVAMRRQFNSLIRKLNYEEDRTLTIEGTLREFWDGLLVLEKELIQSIALSNTQEVMAGEVEGYWLGLTDAFGDVKISLEARLILLNMLQEIFYQVIEMGDLEAPVIPVPTKKSKSAAAG